MASNALKVAGDLPEVDVAPADYTGPAASLAAPSLPAISGPVPASQPTEPSQPTQWQRPSAYFERQMFTDGELAMPDGAVIRFWGFQDPRSADQAKRLPSPIIRVREGETVHIKLELEKEAQKPSPATPRARQTASGAALKSASYVYQWQPKSAGTWLYQSHESSLRQFEMGLFGLLIVEPEPAADGKPRAYTGGPSYDVERCLVLDDVDPAWHGGAEASGAAAEAREFKPKYFLVNGVPNVEALDHPDVAIAAKPGDKVLIRLLNASFSLVKMRVEKLKGDIISVDGKALATPDRPWTKWNPVGAGQPIGMATGARHDLLIDLAASANPVAVGDEFLVTFEYLDFATRKVRNADALSELYIGRAVTKIRIV